MNTAHWHLLLNHLPAIGAVIGTLILIGGFLLKNNPIVKQTALVVFIFSAITAIPAYLTGEGAEELIEKLPGVSEQIIEAHEDLGKLFLIIVAILGVLSIVTLTISKKGNRLTGVLYIIVLNASLGTCILAKQVGTSGGEIRHTEIQNGNINQGINTIENNNSSEKDDD
jgi:uncharacterized membrane protein